MRLVAFVAIETVSATLEENGVMIFHALFLLAFAAKILSASQALFSVILFAAGIAHGHKFGNFLFHVFSGCG